jgi:hypothetical protein
MNSIDVGTSSFFPLSIFQLILLVLLVLLLRPQQYFCSTTLLPAKSLLFDQAILSALPEPLASPNSVQQLALDSLARLSSTACAAQVRVHVCKHTHVLDMNLFLDGPAGSDSSPRALVARHVVLTRTCCEVPWYHFPFTPTPRNIHL